MGTSSGSAHCIFYGFRGFLKVSRNKLLISPQGSLFHSDATQMVGESFLRTHPHPPPYDFCSLAKALESGITQSTSALVEAELQVGRRSLYSQRAGMPEGFTHIKGA